MSKIKKKVSKILFGSLIVLVLIGIFVHTQGFSLIGDGDTVWIPDYGTVKCERTRLECHPGSCSDTNPELGDINQKGESLWCGPPTLSDANYYEGCSIYFAIDGVFDFTKIDVCDGDGTSCKQVQLEYDSGSFISGMKTKKVEIRADEKVYVNPTIAKYDYHIVAPVYGISIEGAVKPKYSDRCNLASLLNDKQLATLKNSPDYAKTVNAGEINPGNFPVVFIVGYKASYKDQRVIEKSGESWFVEDIGRICKIAEDTNGRFVVTDECRADNSIECYPNVGNCDKNGNLITSSDGKQKACEPGTLIGSSTGRVAINPEKACKTKCNENGVPVNYDCIDIPACSEGKVLSQDYECVDSTKLTEQELCEANDGKWKESKDNDGNLTYECDYSDPDYFVFYLVLGSLGIIIIMLLVKMNMTGKKKRRKKR